MNPCGVITGFFLLNPCGRPSVTACARCGRALCQHHADASGLCPECAAPADPYDSGWASGYRRTYYSDSSTTYNDPNWYSTFDSYDRGAFDQGGDWASGGGDFDGDDFGDSGFVDS
ncbi:hypothetical protein [Actinomadura atramentaria]|uniref:hypothetical protein n=1 Tax=Actinomadura atramentaria TaxID=1990 RepID=UPI00039ECBB4|nr:hypothetical protein [Actinomadura atramentaria]